MAANPLDRLVGRLPRHGALLDAMRSAVVADERWRFLELGCSLGAGAGDDLSDIDAGIGYIELSSSGVDGAITEFAARIGEPVDLIVHGMDGSPSGVRRLAATYSDGLQLDLVFMPAGIRAGRPDRTIVLVDKDHQLDREVTPARRLPPSVEEAREWAVLGWWAVATAGKYVRRRSLFEAVHAIDEARTYALRLWAAGHSIPYAAFGLTSLLDFPPFELPALLLSTYAVPDDPSNVAAANVAVADLLVDACAAASVALHADISSPLASPTRRRLTSP